MLSKDERSGKLLTVRLDDLASEKIRTDSYHTSTLDLVVYLSMASDSAQSTGKRAGEKDKGPENTSIKES